MSPKRSSSAGGKLSVLELQEIVPAPVRGQGIAWDRSRAGVVYGVVRATGAERAAGRPHRVDALRLDGR